MPCSNLCHIHARSPHAHICPLWVCLSVCLLLTHRVSAQLSPPEGGSQCWIASISQCVVSSQRFGLVSSLAAGDSEVSLVLFFQQTEERGGEGQRWVVSVGISERVCNAAWSRAHVCTVSLLCNSGRSASPCPCMSRTLVLSVHLSLVVGSMTSLAQSIWNVEKWSSCTWHIHWWQTRMLLYGCRP